MIQNKYYVLKVTEKQYFFQNVESPYFVYGTMENLLKGIETVEKKGKIPDIEDRKNQIIARFETKEELKNFIKKRGLEMSSDSRECYLGAENASRELKLDYRKGYFLIESSSYEDTYYYLFDDEEKYDMGYFILSDKDEKIMDDVIYEIIENKKDELEDMYWGAIDEFYSAKDLAEYVRDNNINIIEEAEVTRGF